MRSYLPLSSCLFLLVACYGAPADESTGGPESTSSGSTTAEPTTGGSSTGEVDPLLEGAPIPNVSPDGQDVDVFGDLGLRYWFVVSPEQLARMNEKDMNGGDLYTPGGAETYAEHLFVTAAGDAPTIADYGKVEVRLIGGSTFREWSRTTIPSLKIDTDEFTDGLDISGVEHVRLHNGQVGSIYRERIALEIYARLGYPAARSTFAWVGSNVWGPGVEVPYTAVENYKRAFCERQGDAWGGGCENMWEFFGDLGGGVLGLESSCQLASCDTTRAEQFEALVLATPAGPGFKAALADWLDWGAFHRFQCLSWALWTGDDALHNQNNVVLVERKDGLFQYLPYSVDISGGQEWYTDVPLYGTSVLAYGCQADPECWDDTIAACEQVIEGFAAIDPPAIVDAIHGQLVAQGMLRDGDLGRYADLRAWYAARVGQLAAELDTYRELPCQPPKAKCDGACVDVQECTLSCAPDEVQCGPACVPVGACVDCPPPFEPCGDGSCVPPGVCKQLPF